MNTYSRHHIEALLDKFMAGETTIEEEAQLSDYFASASDVPAEWEDYRAMFGYIGRGLEGDLVPPSESRPSLVGQMGRRWWGIAAAACITAAVVGTVIFHRPTTVAVPDEPAVIAHQPVDTIVKPVPVVEDAVPQQQLASSTPVRTARSARSVRSVRSVRSIRSTRHLQAENRRLAEENERLQRELEDLKRRAFIIDMEAMGYKAVKNEDGNIVFIDLNQEIEDQFNNQATNNFPAI